MRVKRFLALAIAGCLLLGAVGCSTEGGDSSGNGEKSTSDTSEIYKIMPSALGDEYIICVNELDLEIEKDYTMYPGFGLHILSKQPLSDGDVEVDLGNFASCELSFNESIEQKGKFNEEICLQYNDADWKKLKTAEDGTDDEELLEYWVKTDEEYAALSDELFPHFYDNSYAVYIDMNTINPGSEIDEMEVIINGDSTTVDIGTISFLEYRSERDNVGDYDLLFNSVGSMGVNIGGRSDGLMTLPPQVAEVNEDVVIKDIYLLTNSDTLSIENVSIDLTSDDLNINQKWKKGEDFEIEKGCEATFNYELKDTKFAENLNYSVNIYILIEYESGGETYVADNQVLCETRYNSQMMYAMYKDNIDFSSYYEVYPMQ